MRKIIVFLIGVYQQLPKFRPPVCRFYPSCSAYTKEAVEKYGAAKGLFLGAKRLLKCHPFHPGGYDPLTTQQINRDYRKDSGN
jgi:uncharacterized protein